MPNIYMRLSQDDRVRRTAPDGRTVEGTVTGASWESALGERYFILWDGSALARRYTLEQLQQHNVERAAEPGCDAPRPR